MKNSFNLAEMKMVLLVPVIKKKGITFFKKFNNSLSVEKNNERI